MLRTRETGPLDYSPPGTSRLPFNRLAVAAGVLGASALFQYGVMIGRFQRWELRSPALVIAAMACLVGLCAIFVGYVRPGQTVPIHRWNVLAPLGLLLGESVLLMAASATPRRALYTPVSAICASNLRQVRQAAMLYANEHDGQLPDGVAGLLTGDVTTSVFVCRATNDTAAAAGPTAQATAANVEAGGHFSYVYLGKDWMADEATAEVEIAYEPLANHANTGMNVLFGDGHVEWLDGFHGRKLLAELEAGHNPPRAEGLN